MGDTVYVRGVPPLPFGAIDYPIAGQWPLYAGIDPLNLGAYEGLACLLVAAPFDPAQEVDIPGPPLPFGEPGLGGQRWSFKGAAPSIYPAATIGRSSRPEDTPSNTYVPGKLSAFANYSMELFSGADPTTAGSDTVGTIEIVDPEDEDNLDRLLSLGLDGAPLQLLRGNPATNFSTWQVVASLTAAGMVYDQRKKQIQLRDLAWLLNIAPLHGIRYLGTGGLEGDAALPLAGRLKPYALGTFFNASPVLINAEPLCYQISLSSVRSLVVKDGGDPFTFDGDDPDYATLLAATIDTGHYRTCRALGIFRLGGRPLLACTVDGQGDNDTLNGHVFPNTRADLARRIATGRGTVRLDDSAQLDGASFVELANKQGGPPCGYYWDGASDVTKGQALSQCLAGCLGYWFMRLNGQLAVGQVEDPATQSAYVSFSFPAPKSGEVRVAEPSMTAWLAPTQAILIGWSRNFTPMGVTQIAGVLDITTSGILQAPSRYATSADQWVANAYPTAPIAQVDGGFAFQADAQTEADRQQALRRVRRERYSIDVIADPWGDWVGRIINIANFTRFGMTASKNFLCCGASVSNGPAVTLSLWG